MSDIDDLQPPDGRHTTRVVALALAAPVLVAALVVAVVAVVVGTGGGDAADATAHRTGTGLAAAPLDLAAVSPGIAGHFTYAKAHQDAYRQIPCYCGCEEFLGHRHLYDCFVRADGKGWDAHAAGCGVCIGESVTARRLLDEGQDPAAVRAAVIEQFGSTPATTPPV